MNYIFYCFALLATTGLSSCKISLVPQKEASLFSAVLLEKLVAEDISENKSQLSTREDEIFLFFYQVRDSTLVYNWQSPLLVFTTIENERQLSITINELRQNDRLTFFLLELDNDTLNDEVVQQLEKWVLSAKFPSGFERLIADNEIGHDDLLGVHSVLFSSVKKQSPVIFKGLQLFDRFHYELYFKVQ